MCEYYPKIGEIVQVERVKIDEDGTWLKLVGYDGVIYDASCFRKLNLEDVKKIQEKQELVLS